MVLKVKSVHGGSDLSVLVACMLCSLSLVDLSFEGKGEWLFGFRGGF